MKRMFVVSMVLMLALAGMAMADDNEAEVLQVGSDNTATVTQSADFQRADVLQFGDDNTATVTQQDSDDNTGFVFQAGTLNTASISQSWTGSGSVAGSNLAEQFQFGFENLATIIQRGNSAADNYAIQVQAGSGNTARTEQVALAHEAYIYQFGDDNDSNIYQHHNGSYAESMQFGSDNDVYIRQYTSAGVTNEAYAYQFGDGNDSTIMQRLGSTNTGLRGNFAGSLQLGTDNTSSITQQGDFNTAAVGQLGSGNTATVTQ